MLRRWGKIVDVEITSQHKKTKTFQFEFSKYRCERPGKIIRFLNVGKRQRSAQTSSG